MAGNGDGQRDAPSRSPRRDTWKRFHRKCRQTGRVIRNPTLADVARHAGVSPATASRVVSGRGPASAGARHRVAAAVADLGYVPNATARALATQQAGAVVLAIS
ncbi:MAG: LacI family DNA-binding transcriptional regulator, partial [Saccharothrix sp.]|nr:LacI family DNA-binding transcriptional regulator [Saccharothrix sp.]